MKIVLYIAASLDGFIARPDGALDWLEAVEQDGEDYGYAAFYASIDVLLMGRKTYEVIQSFGDWPYADKPSYVFSRSPMEKMDSSLQIVHEPVSEFLLHHNFKDRTLWLVGGGQLASSLLAMRKVDEIILSTLPKLLGEGVPLFTHTPKLEQDFKLLSSRPYESGLVQTHYRKID